MKSVKCLNRTVVEAGNIARDLMLCSLPVALMPALMSGTYLQ